MPLPHPPPAKSGTSNSRSAKCIGQYRTLQSRFPARPVRRASVRRFLVTTPNEISGQALRLANTSGRYSGVYLP